MINTLIRCGSLAIVISALLFSFSDNVQVKLDHSKHQNVELAAAKKGPIITMQKVAS